MVGDTRPWKGAWDSLPSCPRMTGRVRATESLKGGEQMVRALTEGSLCIVVSQGCHSPRGGGDRCVLTCSVPGLLHSTVTI